MKDITELATNLGLDADKELTLYGKYKAKVSHRIMRRLREKPDGKLILTTAMTPTSAGEGKTTVTIGLGQALNKLGKKSFICIREPSLGPCFGMKGGATGGGLSQVLPMEDINLQFTGDLPAVTAANNLLSAVIDNHIFHGNELKLDPQRITWTRALDMNDRALRRISIRSGELQREESFQITPASEVMAILCLSENIPDLKKRLGEIIVGYTIFGGPVRAKQLKVEGAMAALLKDALNPNLVQTTEGVPAFVHGGPFANIAHGCSSLIATKMALKLADYVVTESGFGADLGAEKFFNIKCRIGGLKPSAVVLVATIKALHMHGNGGNLNAVKRGFGNLEKQIENIRKYGLPLVVALNRFEGDSPKELNWVVKKCASLGVKAFVAEVWSKGSVGGLELANEVLKLTDEQQQKKKNKFRFLYSVKDSIKNKIRVIAREMYGASDVLYTESAERDIRLLEKEDLNELPVCMSKTQKSLSDDPKLLGRPRNFSITVKEVKASAGAGFLVAMAGDIVTMPGLPKAPAAVKINVTGEGEVTGLT